MDNLSRKYRNNIFCLKYLKEMHWKKLTNVKDSVVTVSYPEQTGVWKY